MFEEVLSDLKKLCFQGPIKAVSDKPNGIGLTLRSALKIEDNRSRYKGFKINATNYKSNTRFNIISGCVPDWNLSEVKSSTEFVDLYGIEDESAKYKKKLFCTVEANSINSFGLYLKINNSKKILFESFSKNNLSKDLVCWSSEKLMQKLKDKDKTIFLYGQKLKKDGQIYYHYKIAEFCINPNYLQFLNLIEFGSITMDHAISLEHASNRAREQGPLFKIARDSVSDLFSEYKKFDLMD